MEREDPTSSYKDKYGSREVIPKPYPVGTATPTIREELPSRKAKQKYRENAYTFVQ